MRRVVKKMLIACGISLCALLSTSCLRQDYIMFEDGEFDGMEFSDYDLTHNSEMDMDDVDRD